MIIRTVVVARQFALALAGQALDIRELALVDIGREDVKALIEQRRHENDALAVGRESRLDIDRAVGQERLRGATGQFQYP